MNTSPACLSADRNSETGLKGGANMHQTFREENASFQENLGEPRKSLFISIFNQSFYNYSDMNFEKGF